MSAAKEYRCQVKSFRMLTQSVFETTFEADPSFHFEAGQFISIVIPGAGPKGRDLRRAYSIASAPEVRPVELCVKLVEDGPGTNYLYQLRPGDTFRGYAPYGNFVYAKRPERHACFISTGTGIAPFRSMVMSEVFQKTKPISTTCMLGVRDETELIYMEDFNRLPFVRWVPTVSQPKGNWDGFKGRVTDYLRSQGEDYPWLATDYYLCGNGAMIDETKALLMAKGVLKEAIHQEITTSLPKGLSPRRNSSPRGLQEKFDPDDHQNQERDRQKPGFKETSIGWQDRVPRTKQAFRICSVPDRPQLDKDSIQLAIENSLSDFWIRVLRATPIAGSLLS